MDKRFRFIDTEGSEQSIADIPELVRATVQGRISASTMLFDLKYQRWTAAANHDVFQATTVVSAPLEEARGVDPLASHPNPLETAQKVASSTSGIVDEPTSSPAAPRSIDDELRALDAEFAAARIRGFDNEFLQGRYNSERSRIYSEFEDPTSRAKQNELQAATSQRNGMAWRRYFARMIDLLLIDLVFVILLMVANNISESPVYDLKKANGIVLGMLGSIFWIPLAALCLSNWQRTPGKALLRMRVEAANGKRLPYWTAFHREAQVCFCGTAIGFPLIALVTAWSSKRRLETTGRTAWDSALDLDVIQA